MTTCSRTSCGHPDHAHDALGFCDLCPCVGFQHPEDALLDEGELALNGDEEDELDFDEDAER